MRYSADQKAKSKESILRLAGQQLKKDGFSGIGVDGLAAAAGVTSGAFYSNFSNKEELLKEMIRAHLGAPFVQQPATTRAEREAQLKDFLTMYLDVSHCSDPENGCVMPTLSADVSRAHPKVRLVYQERMLELIDKASKAMLGTSAKKRERAWSVISLIVGAVTIGRALPQGKAAAEVMEAAMNTAWGILEGE